MSFGCGRKPKDLKKTHTQENLQTPHRKLHLVNPGIKHRAYLPCAPCTSHFTISCPARCPWFSKTCVLFGCRLPSCGWLTTHNRTGVTSGVTSGVIFGHLDEDGFLSEFRSSLGFSSGSSFLLRELFLATVTSVLLIRDTVLWSCFIAFYSEKC